MMKSFFNRLPDMECLSGDTLGMFRISPKSGSFAGCRMQLIVADDNHPTIASICKECDFSGGTFTVTLTSENTKNLTEGWYQIHFRLIDGNGLSHRKLAGKLFVHQIAGGIDKE